MQFATRARAAAAKDASLGQEWIWASVLLGDLAGLVNKLDLANESYDQALAKSEDPTERRWIANKRHESHYAVRAGANIAYYVHGSGDETILLRVRSATAWLCGSRFSSACVRNFASSPSICAARDARHPSSDRTPTAITLWTLPLSSEPSVIVPSLVSAYRRPPTRWFEPP